MIFVERIGSLVVQLFANRKGRPSKSRNRTGKGAELERNDGHQSRHLDICIGESGLFQLIICLDLSS